MRSLTLWATCTIFLTGCSIAPIATRNPQTTPVPAAANTAPLHGRAHGGQQPIAGAHVYMLAITTSTSNTPYGLPSTSLLQSSGTGDTSAGGVNGWYYVTTDSNGSFTIAATDYTCSNQEVYLYSLGGSPGIGDTSTPNSAIGLMAVLGPFPCQADGSFLDLPATIQLNEATTVAAAYSLAGFAVDATDMSTSNSSLAGTGIANAGGTAVNLGNGQPLATTEDDNGSVPQAEISTLADILAACVNSTDSTYGSPSSACSNLFLYATPPGGTAPGDTATAAIDIAHNPGANVAALFALATPTAPFQPTLSAAPNDWTVLITYSGNGLSYANGVAVDSRGQVWVTDNMNIDSGACSTPGTAACGAISAFNNLGQPLNGSPYTGGGLYFPEGIAIDINGNAWVANSGNDTITEFSAGGAPSTYSPISLGGSYNATQIAVDGDNDVWVVDGYQLTRFAASYSGPPPDSPTFQTSGGPLNGANGVAVDGNYNVWVSNQNSVLAEFVGLVSANMSGFSGGGLSNPTGVAADANGNIWLPNNDAAYDVSEFIPNQATASAGAFAPGSPYRGAGQAIDSYAIAIDGTGNVWIANSSGCGVASGANTGGPISEYSNTGVPISGSNGYQRNCSNSIGPTGIAVDLSGNVWLAGNNIGDGLGELVGAASPTVTPLSLAISFGQLAQEP